MASRLKVLIVEDVSTDAELALRELKKAGIDHTAVRVDTKREFLSRLEEFVPDIILADYTMPEFDGLEALALAHEKCPDTPFIFISGTIGEEVAIESLQRGAVDYILKTNLNRLGPAVERALQDVAERRARLSAERQLNEARIRFEQFMRYLPGAAFIKDAQGRYEFVNWSWEEIRGRKTAEVLGRTDGNLWPELAAQFENNEQLVLDKNDTLRSIETFPRPDGVHQYMVHQFPIRDRGGRPMLVGGISIDVTDRMQLEARLQEREAGLRRAQHMAMLAHVITGPDGSFESWSETLPQLIGVDPSQMPKSAHEWLKILHPDDRAMFRGKSIEAGAKGTRVDVDYRLRRADGAWIQIRQVIEPIQGQADADGKMRWFSTLQDVSEQKRAQEKIARLNRIHAVLSGIDSLIVRVRDRQELFSGACRIAEEHGNFRMVWIGTLDHAKMDVRLTAWAGLDDEFVNKLHISTREDSSAGQGTTPRAVRSKEPAWDNDIASNPQFGYFRNYAMERGVRSAITLPLLVEGEVEGVFGLYAKEPGFFTEAEIKLLGEMAADISFALQSIATQEKLEKLSRIRALSSKINAAIVRIREREALLQETCRIAADHGKFELVWVGSLDVEKQEIRPVAWTGFSPEIAHAVNWATISSGQVLLAEVIQTRRLAVGNDIETGVPSGILRQEALKKGCRSAVCLPLLVDDNVVAAIILFATGRNFFDANELALLNEVVSDISFALQSIARQEQLEYLSYYDVLTGLPNRTLFLDRLNQQMHARSSEPRVVALVLLDLERFRIVNETLGRHGGDELLRLIAQRLEHACNGKDYVARVSADGFGVVVRGAVDAAGVAHIVENKILACFREPYAVNGTELRQAARAGIALFPTDGDDADTLFKNAEAALKKAKGSSERYLFYAADMNARAAQALSLETRLRTAIESRQFVLHYQPKIVLASSRLCGVEALIRWQDPAESGLVPPMRFIPVLEETGMILDVGAWAIRKALADYDEWHARGLQPPRVAVNVSQIQLRQKDFVDMVSSAIKQSKTMPHGLDLEITESLIMKDVEENIRKLKAVRDLGVNIAIDDFGTGYSSLGYLSRLPVNALKIDRSFIIKMASDPDNMTIVSTIISLAHSLNLKVIAEGVETEEQSRFLKLLKCDEMQGYLFSKPLPVEQLAQMLAGRRAT